MVSEAYYVLLLLSFPAAAYNTLPILLSSPVTSYLTATSRKKERGLYIDILRISIYSLSFFFSSSHIKS